MHMFSYLLYIIPLGDRSSDLKKKLESYESHGVIANLLSDSEDEICFHVIATEPVCMEKLVWKTLREVCISNGSYWQVYCGRNITKEMRDEIAREEAEKQKQLQIDEINEVIRREEEPSLKKIRNLPGLSLGTTETAWRFL